MAPTFPGKFESGLRRRISTVGWLTPVGDARRVAQRRWKEALISRCVEKEEVPGEEDSEGNRPEGATPV